MEKKIDYVLKTLCSKAEKTKDNFLTNCDIGFRCDELEKIISVLVEEGYIEKAQKIGQRYVQCKVTKKAFDYFAKEEK